MSRRRALGVAVAALAGCAGPHAVAAPGALASAPAAQAARLPVRIDFEPPLRAPGRLQVACENGDVGVVAAPCTGVDLQLPAGPASVVLDADGATREFAFRVAPGMAPVLWRLAPALRLRTGDGIVDAGVATRPARR